MLGGGASGAGGGSIPDGGGACPQAKLQAKTMLPTAPQQAKTLRIMQCPLSPGGYGDPPPVNEWLDARFYHQFSATEGRKRISAKWPTTAFRGSAELVV
jgi:hypothetical protein